MEERGRIRNKEFKRQLFDMSGLRFGKITPTDVDGFMDFGNRLFVFFESKHGDSPMPTGQRMAMERLVDACQSPERGSVFFLLSHNGDEEEIDVANLPIVKYRHFGQWKEPEKPRTLLDGVNYFRAKHNIN